MDAVDIIAFFDGRPAFDMHVSSRDSFEIPLMIDLAYEFGYVFRALRFGRYTQRLVFERDDGEQARARAWWSVNHYRRYGTWGRPQSRVPLPDHMGPRIDPFEAAKARHALGMSRSGAWEYGLSMQVGALLVVAVWILRDELVVLIPVLLAGIALATYLALRVRFPSKRVRCHQRTVATFELQQAVERGFIPPPPPPASGPGG